MSVLCRLVVCFMGGQLVFDWDRLENFLTRDRPVGNIVTNTKCHSLSIIHVQPNAVYHNHCLSK